MRKLSAMLWRVVQAALVAAGMILAFSGSTSVRAQTAGGFKVVLAGDAILNRKLSVYKDPGYQELFERVRQADAAFTNFESLIHNYDIPGAAVSGGAYQTSPTWIVDELKWAGFNLLSVANNHAYDYGVEGLRSTLRALDGAGLEHAGAGENLARARTPAYLETAHGRVALVACASTFLEGSLAGEQRPDLIGRPGISPLRFTTSYTLDAVSLEELRHVAAAVSGRGAGGAGGGRGGGRGGNTVRFMGNTFQLGEKSGSHTEPLKGDLDGILSSVREARRQADWVVFSIHTHEGQPGHTELAADFIVTAAHLAIDAGADIFVAHGPHILRGIEIYKGKPIFYSMANFAFENETMRFQPAESYAELGLPSSANAADYFDARSANDTRGFPVERAVWESVIAEVSFGADRKVSAIVLDPISLGFGEPRAQRGRPRPASPELSRTIVERVATLSAPLGTKVQFVSGRGVVDINNGGSH